MFSLKDGKFMPRSIILMVILLAGLGACTDREAGGDIPVARVGEAVLYQSELAGVVPAGFQAEDSLRMTQDYIETWIRQQVILQVAERDMNLKDKDFRQQLEDYKRSLILFKFESEIVAQRLDTIVSEDEIVKYYEEYQRNFELKENIVKVRYVKATPGTPDLNKLRKLIRLDEPAALEELEEYCLAYAVNYFLDDQTWLYFNDLLKEIPIQTYNQEAYLQNNTYIELNADPYIYFVRFMDFRIRESISPLSFERENIRSILLNRRKISLIREVQDELMKQARESGKVQVY